MRYDMQYRGGGLRVAALFTLIAALSACAPCVGMSSCTSDPRFVLVGSTVRIPNGEAAPGIRLNVRLTRDSSELGGRIVASDDDGMWELRVDAGDERPALAHVWVISSPTDSFAIPAFEVQPVTRKGDAVLLGPWFSEPYTLQLRSILLDGAPMVHAKVRFTPTGGVAPANAPVWRGQTNGAGIFEQPLKGTAVGDAFGQLVIQHPDLDEVKVIDNYRVEVGYKFVFPTVRGTLLFYSKP